MVVVPVIGFLIPPRQTTGGGGGAGFGRRQTTSAQVEAVVARAARSFQQPAG
jgi:hypothetical protein